MDVAARVSRAVAEPELAGEERDRARERFAELISSRRFLPSVPILANAGRSNLLAACYVIEPEDSLASIYETLGLAARIQQGAGGAGIDFSRLRPRGTPIRRSGGESPGTLAFIELFAHSARVNERAGRRPGAHLAVLDIGHADARELVRAARANSERLSGMGLALAVSDAFLAAAPPLLDELCAAIVETGQPSLLFADVIEATNPEPELGRIRATNPCGEQPLLPGESCVLGSLDLPAFADARGSLDWESLGEACALAIRFLDDVVEIARFPDPAIERATLRTRKLGLGFLGLADLALLRGLAFDGPELRALAGELARFLGERALRASAELAERRGPYPAFRGRGARRRNATTTAIAPTGTLRLLSGSNGGIEPLLEPVRTIALGDDSVRFVDRWVRAWLEDRAADPEAVLVALAAAVPSEELPGLSDTDRRLLRRGFELDARAQIGVQAEVQRHVDGAVSKTVQLAKEAQADDVRALVLFARSAGCKGVALYRGGPGCSPCALPERSGEWI
ncbi:MAG: ribonucleotide reductase N-terminal alpha domain-containing protein [Myxococcota bacterium]